MESEDDGMMEQCYDGMINYETIAGNVWNIWTWQEMAGMAANDWNRLKWIDMFINC